MRHATVVLLAAAIAVGAAGAADPPEAIHYQGVLRDAADQPLTGTFAMVFRFFNQADGGDEILGDSHASVVVDTGLFGVDLGTGSIIDGNGPGTYSSLLDVFRDYGELWIEVEVAGETLLPRIEFLATGAALNSRLVRGHELATGGPLNLYVNGTTGDDANDGRSESSPKATIQAAVDLIPAVLYDEVTVRVADGTYEETVVLLDRTSPVGAVVTLEGNPTTPTSVVISGSNTRPNGLRLEAMTAAIVEGFTIRDHTNWALFVTRCGNTSLRNVRVEDNLLGVIVIRSTVLVDTVTVSNQSSTGFFCTATSRCQLTDLTTTGNYNGVIAERGAQVLFIGPVTSTGNSQGCWASSGAAIEFRGRSDAVVTGNTTTCRADLHGRVTGYSSATMDAPECEAWDYGLCLAW